jgi:iron complex outermembrane receptor protein
MRQILLTIMVGLTVNLAIGQDTTNVTYLEPIEVSGVRATDKTPITQKTIKRDEIQEKYQGQEMSMILDKTPSVTSSTDGGHPQGYTYFRLRGIDQTRVNMTLNGVPLNEPEDQGVYFSNYPGFANNVNSMQVQRGVGTSTNGVASYAGSINYESPSGLDTIREVQLGYGSFNTKRFSITNSTGLSKKKFALYSNFSTLESDGYKYNSGGFGYSAFLSGGYYGENDIVKLTAFSGRSMNDMAWYAVSETDIKVDPRTNYNSPNETDDFMQSFVQLQHIKFLNDNSTLTSSVYYNRLDGNWGLDVGDVLNFKLGSNLMGAMSNYQLNRDNLTVNIGVHGNKYDRRHAMLILPNLSDELYSNTGYKNSLSSFGKVAYDYKKFTFFGDVQVRYTSFDYRGDTTMPKLDWTFVNPKGGIRFNMNDNMSLYTSVGKSHREPTRTDMFGGEDNLIGLNIITPEEVMDYELGVNYDKKKLKVQANVYYMDFKNEITLLGALGSNGLPLMTNVEQSFRSGIEFDGVYQVNKNLSLTNNSSYSYNRIVDGGTEYQPLYTPNLIVNQGVAYTYKGFKLAVLGKYHSESFIDTENSLTTPEFMIFNSNISYEWGTSTFMVQVNNITSKEYYTNGYAIGGERYFYVNAPRSVYVTYKFNF